MIQTEVVIRYLMSIFLNPHNSKTKLPQQYKTLFHLFLCVLFGKALLLLKKRKKPFLEHAQNEILI